MVAKKLSETEVRATSGVCLKSFRSYLTCLACAGLSLVAACGDDVKSDGGNTVGNVCVDVTCSGHGTCEVKDGAAICRCDDGYHAKEHDATKCEADEPGEVKSVCDGVDCSGHGTCEVTDGAAVCSCDDGYKVNADDPKHCEAADPGNPGDHTCNESDMTCEIPYVSPNRVDSFQIMYNWGIYASDLTESDVQNIKNAGFTLVPLSNQPEPYDKYNEAEEVKVINSILGPIGKAIYSKKIKDVTNIDSSCKGGLLSYDSTAKICVYSDASAVDVMVDVNNSNAIVTTFDDDNTFLLTATSIENFKDSVFTFRWPFPDLQWYDYNSGIYKKVTDGVLDNRELYRAEIKTTADGKQITFHVKAGYALLLRNHN